MRNLAKNRAPKSFAMDALDLGDEIVQDSFLEREVMNNTRALVRRFFCRSCDQSVRCPVPERRLTINRLRALHVLILHTLTHLYRR